MCDPHFVPEWAKEVKVGQGVVACNGNSYTYHVLDRRLELDLPGFTGFINGEFLFISDEVPPEFREFVLRHEIREMLDFKDRPGRCLECLKWELSEFVPDDLRENYLKYRRAFFQRLVQYYEKKGDPKGLLPEIRQSRDFLEKI